MTTSVKFCLSYDRFKLDFIVFKVDIISIENAMLSRTSSKGNITFVCAHTANAAGFFPAIIVVTSNATQKCQRRIVDYLYQGFYALSTLYGTCAA